MIYDAPKYGSPPSSGEHRPSDENPVVEVDGESARPKYITAEECKERLEQIIAILEDEDSKNDFTQEEIDVLVEESDQLKKSLDGLK